MDIIRTTDLFILGFMFILVTLLLIAYYFTVRISMYGAGAFYDIRIGYTRYKVYCSLLRVTKVEDAAYGLESEADKEITIYVQNLIRGHFKSRSGKITTKRFLRKNFS